MELTLLTTAFLAGLAGLFHCVGMCGPLVAGYASVPGPHPKAVLHLSYSVGRLTAYGLLGALFGALGQLLDVVAYFAQIGPIAGILAGIFLVMTGMHQLGWLKKLPFQPTWGNLPFVGRVVRKNFTQPTPFSTFLLGSCSGFLPCHLLMPMEVMAAGTASPFYGALVMIVFGLGTLPNMVGFGFAVQKLSEHLKDRLLKISAVMILLAGIAIIFVRVDIHSALAFCLPGLYQ